MKIGRYIVIVATIPCFCNWFQNAEMTFNFGAQPFKHAPPAGFTAVTQAPKNNVKHSEETGEAAVVTRKVNNAPQAIIIEVILQLLYF